MAPMPWRNTGAATAHAGLPRARGAALPAPGTTRGTLLVEVASQFTQDTGAGEDVVLDVETTTVVLALEHGFSQRWSASIELPWVRHGRGVLDGAIDGYHDLLGLPDGGRDDAPRDRLLLAWRDDGRLRFALGDARSGIGDVRLELARLVLDTPGRQVTLRGGVELPTGDAQQLTGSDSVDISLGLHASDDRLFSAWGWTTHLAAGVLLQGDDDIADGAARALVGWGNWTLARPVTSRWTIKGQLDAHTATADSALRQIGGWSVQAGLGASLRLRRDLVVEAGFIEDLRPGSAPDITFQLSFRGTL